MLRTELAQERLNLANHFVGHRGRDLFDKLSPALAPVKRPHLIGQHNAADLVGISQLHLKGIAFYSARDRTEEREPDAPIVAGRREHESRTVSGLLVTSLWIELEPHSVTPIGGIAVDDLPRLLANRLACRHFIVHVLVGDAFEELIERPFLRGNLPDDDPPLLFCNLDEGALIDVCLARYSFGDADTERIAPFSNARLHNHLPLYSLVPKSCTQCIYEEKTEFPTSCLIVTK